jgi:hypothetical protein
MRILTGLLICTSALALAACGDNGGSDDTGDDAQVDAAPQPDGEPGDTVRGVVVAGDFDTVGTLATIDLPSRTVTQNAVAGVAGTDPVLRRSGDELLIVNRFGADNITIVHADTLALIDQVSTGAGSNPQDVAAVGDKLYVAALAEQNLIVIDRAAGNAVDTIDLSSLDPDDDFPDCMSVYAVGTTVYVACGNLEDFAPRGPGKIAVIDAATDTLTTSFELDAANPTGQLQPTPVTSFFGGDLVIGTVPDFNDYSVGCIARIATGAEPGANGCAVANADLDGYANRIEPSPEGTILWMVVNGFDPDPFGRLGGLDLVTGELWTGSLSPDTELITDLAVCPNAVVIVADRTPDATGLRVYDNATQVTTAALPIGIAPGFGSNMTCYAR